MADGILAAAARYFSKWTADGTWKNISDCLTVDLREKVGKSVQPSVGIIDRQSVKNSPAMPRRLPQKAQE
ncbi:MAG: hypothetical protein AAF632_26595 [Bacteroidota bacterium]